MTNKYLVKVGGMIKEAVVSSSVKAYRRALELAQSGSHDFHGTGVKNLASILKKKTLEVRADGHNLHGKGVYFGRGRPAVGYEPSGITSQVGVPKKESRKLLPGEGVNGEDFAIDRKPVRLSGQSGKTYITLPNQKNITGVKDILYQNRKARARVIPNDVFRQAFSKVDADYDPFKLSGNTPLDKTKADLFGKKQLAQYFAKKS